MLRVVGIVQVVQSTSIMLLDAHSLLRTTVMRCPPGPCVTDACAVQPLHHGVAGKERCAQQCGRGALHHLNHRPHARHVPAHKPSRQPCTMAPWCAARSNGVGYTRGRGTPQWWCGRGRGCPAAWERCSAPSASSPPPWACDGPSALTPAHHGAMVRGTFKWRRLHTGPGHRTMVALAMEEAPSSVGQMM